MSQTKRFGFWTLAFLVVANMVGAGVFTTSGFSLSELGSPFWVLVAWVIGGLIACAGAISYGQLARVMPHSGGEYLFLSRAASPFLGFLAGWVSLVAGFTGAIAFAATAFESYVMPAEARPAWLPENAVAIAVIVVAALFHGMRPRVGATIQNVAVVLKLGLLAVFLGIAALTYSRGEWQGGELPDGAPVGLSLIGALAVAVVWISLSYSGFNAAVYVAGEAVDAPRSVPIALLTGTFLVMLLYLLLNTVFVYAPPPELIQGKEDVAAIAAETMGGVTLATFVRLIIAAALFTSVMSMMMAAPRVYAKMADDGMLPALMRFQKRSPWLAIEFQAWLAIVLVVATSLQGLLFYLGLTLSLSAAASVFCLLLPSVRTKPLLHVSHVAPVFYIVSTLVAGGIMAVMYPWQVVGTLVTFAVGARLYLLIDKRDDGQWGADRLADKPADGKSDLGTAGTVDDLEACATEQQ